jgi:hypothetical protein
MFAVSSILRFMFKTISAGPFAEATQVGRLSYGHALATIGGRPDPVGALEPRCVR